MSVIRHIFFVRFFLSIGWYHKQFNKWNDWNLCKSYRNSWTEDGKFSGSRSDVIIQQKNEAKESESKRETQLLTKIDAHCSFLPSLRKKERKKNKTSKQKNEMRWSSFQFKLILSFLWHCLTHFIAFWPSLSLIILCMIFACVAQFQTKNFLNENERVCIFSCKNVVSVFIIRCVVYGFLFVPNRILY